MEVGDLLHPKAGNADRNVGELGVGQMNMQFLP